ncbi:MAG: APC family permease [Campylobacteraceae bacterium]|nr:APC family permease [Campylobacteraceae bacterium]
MWSAIFLGIGSMVGAGIFVLLGEAGAIAGNLVWISFVLGGIIALSAGYSLAKLAVAYPSRGGMVEYLVQCYGEGTFSGSASILFYLSSIVGITMVAKTFGVYMAHMFSQSGVFYDDIYAIAILMFFVIINLAGSSLIAKSENIIVLTKLTIIVAFTVIVSFYIKPELLSFKDAPAFKNVFFAISLTFFAYGGFSVISNTAEDMNNPKATMMKAMIYSILIVMVLYIAVVFAVFGNLPLDEIVKAKDYALAEAAKPIFGEWGFKIMALTALLATASAINATLYAATEIGYTLAKEGNLPNVYTYNVHSSYGGLIVSGLFIIPMILFLNLSEVTTIAALVVLMIQGLTHIGHLFRIKNTGANKFLVIGAIASMFSVAILTMYYTSQHSMPLIAFYILGAFGLAFMTEVLLRLLTKRVISKQTHKGFIKTIENDIKEFIGEKDGK